MPVVSSVMSVCAGGGGGEKTYRAVQIGQMRQTAKLVLVCQGHFSEQKAITRSCDMTFSGTATCNVMGKELCRVISSVCECLLVRGCSACMAIYI